MRNLSRLLINITTRMTDRFKSSIFHDFLKILVSDYVWKRGKRGNQQSLFFFPKHVLYLKKVCKYIKKWKIIPKRQLIIPLFKKHPYTSCLKRKESPYVNICNNKNVCVYSSDVSHLSDFWIYKALKFPYRGKKHIRTFQVF